MLIVNRKNIVLAGGLMSLFLLSSAVMAEGWTDRTSISGFYSARYSIADKQAYFHGDSDTGINKEGSFQGTKMGLTVTSRVSNKLSVAMLLMSADDHEGYSVHADWAFASFSLSDTFTLRVGKLKFPVGLVNEYVDVGAAYPWISAPILLYTDESAGAQATREAYTGGSLLWEGSFDDWTLGGDLFGGQVDLEGMSVKTLVGATLRANWDDMIEFQASAYKGEMHTASGEGMSDMNAMSNMMAAMNEKQHSAKLIGVKVDWNNIVAYAELAKVTMDVTMMGEKIGDSIAWYTTLGYRVGKFLPHITRQDWERDNGSNHQISTAGLSYSLSDSTVLKAEWSIIKTDNYATNPGLYTGTLSGDSTNLASVSVDVIF